jgi:hypothetical protein
MSNLNNRTQEFGRDSSLPIAALVLSFLFPIVGAIMGHVALSQMKSGQITSLQRGHARAAVILGWCLTALYLFLIPFIVVLLSYMRFWDGLTYN